MKKIILSLLFTIMFTLVLSPVLALTENKPSNNSVSNVNEKNQVALENRTENLSSRAAELARQKEDNKSRVRFSLQARLAAYDNIATRSGTLLDKLQIRINIAKTAGENTTNMETQMADARAKLADAKLKMDGIKSLIGTNLDKNGFKDAQKSLQAVHKDLNIVKQDAAKIISTLKSFNSNKESTKSAEKRSINSATRSATERE